MVDPTPPVRPPIPWAAIFAVVAALIGGMHFGPAPTPNPNPPINPTPVDPVKPEPKPKPGPTPTNGVTIVDTHGNTVQGSIDSGFQFVVTAATDTTLTAVASSQPDADITKVSNNKLVITLRNGCKLQIVVTGPGFEPQIIAITALNGAKPPPDNPDPAPDPKPKSRLLSLAVVEDPMNRSVATSECLQDTTLWNSFQAKGHRVRVYAPTTPEPLGIAAVQAWTNKATVPLPVLVVTDLAAGTPIAVIPLPAAGALKSTIESYGG